MTEISTPVARRTSADAGGASLVTPPTIAVPSCSVSALELQVSRLSVEHPASQLCCRRSRRGRRPCRRSCTSRPRPLVLFVSPEKLMNSLQVLAFLREVARLEVPNPNPDPDPNPNPDLEPNPSGA